ncbi:iron complex outermembrane recepter protein [Saccharicrinis carchari]|uniref:Iron complex outermembrane recepter protein n=1 Tax=Saccharicrinis carchari TaxID=1168039 RepID=A0A521AT02_SACCC|nr:TonB-dependent receptor [Saccharicrinis carchari]SMO37934.1 iron complex outermembrane recepter protein [Saccharicrinis carchari]
MAFKKTIARLLLCSIFCFATTLGAFGQNKQQIRLLDTDSGEPLQGASFKYGVQSGLSDDSGILEFKYEEGTKMSLSHINYGVWEWSAMEVAHLLRQKIAYQKSISQKIYPITVLALRPGSNKPWAGMKLEYHDRLAHDAADILNQTPMLNSIRKGGNYGFDPVFRGFKYDQLNIVLNGAQSATAACPNRMDPPSSQMAPNMMERIEVLKGPHALRYGTGFGATINFVPTRLHFTDKANTYGRVSSGYEGNGEVFTGEGQLGFSAKAYDVSFFGAWAQGNDYETGSGQRVQSDFERGSFGANLGFKLSANQQLRVASTYNVARDVDFPALPMDLRKDDTWMLNAHHQINIPDKQLKSWSSTVFASFVDHLMDNLLKPINPRMMNSETPAKTYNYGARTEGFWQFEKATLFAGADWRAEGAEGTRKRTFVMGPNTGKILRENAWQKGHIDKLGVFGECHVDIDNLQLVMSGRVEVNSADVDDADANFLRRYPETKQTQFNPSISLGASHKYDSGITLGFWLGRAQRSAGLTERFINYFPVGQDPYEMIGNPQLDAEVNNQVDITFDWTAKKTSVNIDVFASYMQNFISSRIDPGLNPTIPTSPGVRRYVNLDEAVKAGFEFTWTQEPVAGLQYQMAVAYTYAKDLERNQPLPEIAPLDFRCSMQGVLLHGRLLPEASFRHVLEQKRISPEYGETRTPSFSMLDVKLSYRLMDALRLTIGVNNVFNVNYYEHLNRSVRGSADPIFAPGRNVFASVSASF